MIGGGGSCLLVGDDAGVGRFVEGVSKRMKNRNDEKE
jgi:hypothetical protein